jgi:hypothetical protein
MADEQQTSAQDSTTTPAPPPTEGTPVVVLHIDFNTPTGNSLVEVRKGYGPDAADYS